MKDGSRASANRRDGDDAARPGAGRRGGGRSLRMMCCGWEHEAAIARADPLADRSGARLPRDGASPACVLRTVSRRRPPGGEDGRWRTRLGSDAHRPRPGGIASDADRPPGGGRRGPPTDGRAVRRRTSASREGRSDASTKVPSSPPVARADHPAACRGSGRSSPTRSRRSSSAAGSGRKRAPRSPNPVSNPPRRPAARECPRRGGPRPISPSRAASEVLAATSTRSGPHHATISTGLVGRGWRIVDEIHLIDVIDTIPAAWAPIKRPRSRHTLRWRGDGVEPTTAPMAGESMPSPGSALAARRGGGQ